MRGPAAAAHRAAAAVEEAQLHAGLARHHMQIAMRAEDLPGRGQHAAVFIRVGVAQHHFLPVVPAGEQLAIVGPAPQLAANGGRVAQVFNRLEQRHRHQAGIGPASPEPSTVTPPSRASRTTASTSSTVAAPLITYWRIASGEQPSLTSATTRKVSSTLAVSRGEPAGQRRRDGVADRLLQRRGMNARMLADVERVQMQAEGAHLQDERIDERARDADAAVCRQRSAQRFQIVEKLLRRSSRPAAPAPASPARCASV